MDNVRIGIIGVGGMGSAHANSMKDVPRATLTAICDIDEAVCAAKAEAFGVPGFTKHTELLDSDLVDAVIVATPHYFHPPIAIDAWSRGMHVLSEKPISVTVKAADEMIAAWRKSGLKFSVMYQMRTEAIYIEAKRIIDSGALGEIYRTCMVMGWYRSQAYYDSGGWRATWTGEGGGVLINQAPHLLDIFTWLAGLPAAIHGEVRTNLHDIEVEDEAFAVLTYPNGAHGYLYTSTTEAPEAHLIEISGDKGKLRIQDGKIRLWTVDTPVRQHNRESEEMWSSPRGTEVPVELRETDSGHRAITANFVRAILDGEPLIAPGEEGLNAMEMINGMILSGKTGEKVSVPVDRDRYEALLAELRASSQGKSRLREQRVTDPQHQ